MKKNKGFIVSIGELIDRISILNIKVWKTEEEINKIKNNTTINKLEQNEKIANYALMIRDLNTERSNLREEINFRLEGRTRGTKKIEYFGLGRDKNGN